MSVNNVPRAIAGSRTLDPRSSMAYTTSPHYTLLIVTVAITIFLL